MCGSQGACKPGCVQATHQHGASLQVHPVHELRGECDGLVVPLVEASQTIPSTKENNRERMSVRTRSAGQLGCVRVSS